MARITVPGVQEQVQGVPDRPQGADAAAFGGIDAASASRGAEARMKNDETFVNIAADMNQRQETQDALDASTAMKQYANERTAVMRTVQGKDAEGIAAREAEAFGKARDKISGKLNPRARLAFENQAHATGQAFAEHAAKHEYEQGEKAFDLSNTALLNAGKDAVMANPGDIGVLMTERKNVENITKLMAQRRGWTPEVAKAFQEERITMLHTGTIETMVDGGKYSEAAAYYKTFQKDISGHKQKDMEKLLKEGNIRQTAQEFVDGWEDNIAQSNLVAGDERNISKLEKDGLKALRTEIKDPYKRDRAEAEFKARIAEQKKFLEETQRANTQAGIDAFTRGGHRVAAIPPTVRAAMNPETVLVLENQEARGVRTADHAGDAEGYANEQKKLMDSVRANKTYEFDPTSPIAMRMNKAQRDYLVAASLASTKKEVMPDKYPSATELTLYYNEMGWNKRTDPNVAHEMNVFREKAGQALEEARAKKPDGKPLTPEERTKVFSGLIREGVTSEGSIWNTKKRLHEVWGTPERERWFTPEEIKDNPGITKDGVLAALDKELAARGWTVNKENRIKLNQEWTAKERDKAKKEREGNPQQRSGRQQRAPASPEEY